jgi:hypothetical protein
MGLIDKIFGVQSKVQELFSPAEAFAATVWMVIFPMMRHMGFRLCFLG